MKKRLLLVCEDIALTSRLVVELQHVDITIVRSADAALLVLREHDFDALVVWLRFGRSLDGARVLDARRTRRLNVPAIVVCSDIEAGIFASIQRLDAVPLPLQGLTGDVLGRLIEEPPLGAWPMREGILHVLRRCGFTFDHTHDLAIELLKFVVAELGSIAGAARALGMSRQRAQDVLKRQAPTLTEHP